MGKKVKSTECKGRWCEAHLFSIRPYVSGGSHSKQEIIRLCPKYDSIKKKFSKCLPELNLDRKYYTPLFILEQDRRLYTEYDDRNRIAFERNQEEEEYEISQIVSAPSGQFLSIAFMLPKVANPRRYCKVCKDDYSDYQEHIDSLVHRQCLKKNPYSTFITELQEQMRPAIQKQQENKIEKRLSPHTVDSIIQLDVDTIIPDRQSLTQLKDSQMEPHYRDNIL